MENSNNNPNKNPKFSIDSIKKIFKGIFKGGWFLKILSVIFAVLLWLYVLSSEDPYREKTLNDIPVHFEGENQLNTDQFVISSNKSEVLKDVVVTVSARASVLEQVNASGINVYADLKNVRTAGVHIVRLNATSTIGSVVNIKPATVEVEIDELSSSTVPVQAQYVGQLPDGYWRGECELTPAYITLRGPLSSIKRVSKVLCDVNLTDRTKSVNESIGVRFVDTEGETVPKSGFIDNNPSVIARMQVLPKKTVPLDVVGALVGTDELANNYEVLWSKANPSSVEIAAPQELLDSITKLSVQSVNLQGASESVITNCNVLKPASSVVLIGQDTTEVYVEIGEKTGEVRYDGLTIAVEGLGRDLDASLLQSQASVILTGPLSRTDKVRRGDVSFSVDLTDRPAGTYTVPVDVTLPEGFEDVKRAVTPSTVTVVIENQP